MTKCASHYWAKLDVAKVLEVIPFLMVNILSQHHLDHMSRQCVLVSMRIYLEGKFKLWIPLEYPTPRFQRMLSIGITSPGPHCFLLVLGLSRFTQEEEKSISFFVNYFAEGFFRYFIVLFMRNDNLDHQGKMLDDHTKTVPQNLKTIIAKCGHRLQQ